MFFFFICFLTSHVSANSQGVRVILLVADYLSLKDLNSAGPAVRKMIDNGSVALVNTGKFDTSIDSRYMAIGMGTRVSGDDSSFLFCNTAEKIHQSTAGELYRFQTGRNASNESVVCLGLSRLFREKEGNITDIALTGLLGDEFHRAGLKTAVIGNCDMPGIRERRAPLMAMDKYGAVDSGIVDSRVVINNPDSPGGISDNIDAILASASEYAKDHALVVIELGDLTRVERYRQILSDSAYIYHRTKSIEKMDRLLNSIVPVADSHGAVIIICSPCRVDDGWRSNLTPVVFYGKRMGQGILVSGTTRTNGLISNIDIAPSILNAAGLGVPSNIPGQPVSSHSFINSIDYLARMERVSIRNYSLCIPVLGSIGAISILLAGLSEIVLHRRRVDGRIPRILRLGILSVMALPAALLLVDGIDTSSLLYILSLIFADIVVILISWLLSMVFSRRIENRYTGVLYTMQLSTALLIVVDMLTGPKLLPWTITSCNHITGIRYYGLGNEYMGFLIGMALMGSFLLVRPNYATYNKTSEINRRRMMFALLTAWFGIVVFVIGYPKIGANVGGTLTAVAAFGTALIAFNGTKLRPVHGLMIAASSIAAVGLYAAVDIMGKDAGVSHLGRSLSMANEYGIRNVYMLISSKIIMHAEILALPQAYYPIIFGIPILFLFSKRHKAESAGTKKVNLLDRTILQPVIAGVVIAFFFNDSGIVPAALILSIYVMSSLYLRLGEKI